MIDIDPYYNMAAKLKRVICDANIYVKRGFNIAMVIVEEGNNRHILYLNNGRWSISFNGCSPSADRISDTDIIVSKITTTIRSCKMKKLGGCDGFISREIDDGVVTMVFTEALASKVESYIMVEQEKKDNLQHLLDQYNGMDFETEEARAGVSWNSSLNSKEIFLEYNYRCMGSIRKLKDKTFDIYIGETKINSGGEFRTIMAAKTALLQEVI